MLRATATFHQPPSLERARNDGLVPAVQLRADSSRRIRAACVALSAERSGSGLRSGEDMSWADMAIPTYLQSVQEDDFPCSSGPPTARSKWQREMEIWQSIRVEAAQDAASEAVLSSFLYATILAHDNFEASLAFVLANRLANSTMLPTQLFQIFVDLLQTNDDVRCGALADLEACRDRDPACDSMSHALVFFKGYHALQTQRCAHALWQRGQRVMALALQSRMSEVFAVDIHPAARFGKGILLDHGTGVVIGETAVVGNNCSLMQNVTLGGTGKDVGDRHPKVGNNVLIGAGATILGNITIGKGAQIAAGSLVLKPVRNHAMVAGSPAKEVGLVKGNPAKMMLQWAPKDMLKDKSKEERQKLLLLSIEDSEAQGEGEASTGSESQGSSATFQTADDVDDIAPARQSLARPPNDSLSNGVPPGGRSRYPAPTPLSSRRPPVQPTTSKPASAPTDQLVEGLEDPTDMFYI